MNYTAHDVVNGAPCPRGEVCFKGTNVFAGYYLDPAKTAETLDKDGWLHSGDIGMWLPDQSLKLIDRSSSSSTAATVHGCTSRSWPVTHVAARCVCAVCGECSKKAIFKTAQGEYISPERCENVYQRSPLIAQAFVHGDSLEASLVAIVVPDEEELRVWAGKNKIASRNFADLLVNPAVKAVIQQEMSKTAQEAGLKVKARWLTDATASPCSVHALTSCCLLSRAAVCGVARQGFEVAKAVHLSAVPFSVENELLTPTFKLKRNVAAKHFAKEVSLPAQ